MNILFNNLVKISKYKFIYISILTVLFWTIIISFVGNLAGNTVIHNESFLIDKSYFYKFNIKVLVAPFLETLIFQFLIIEFLFAIFKNYFICIVISSLIFGILHFFNSHNLIYTLAAIITGFLFASIYIISKNRKDLNAFLIVMLVHSSSNFFAFLINDILNS